MLEIPRGDTLIGVSRSTAKFSCKCDPPQTRAPFRSEKRVDADGSSTWHALNLDSPSITPVKYAHGLDSSLTTHETAVIVFEVPITFVSRSGNRLGRSKNRLAAYPHQARDTRNLDRASPLSAPRTRALNRRSRPPHSAHGTPSLRPMVSRDRSMNLPRSEHRSPSARTSSPSSTDVVPPGTHLAGARCGHRPSRGIDRPSQVCSSSDRGGSIAGARGASPGRRGTDRRQLEARNPQRVARRAR
jgi:hypothetical protein